MIRSFQKHRQSQPTPFVFLAKDEARPESADCPALNRASLEKLRHRILVADDEPGDRLILREALEQNEFEVLEAENGQEAADIFETQRPGLVLLDVFMSLMDGLKACRQLRKLSEGEAVLLVDDESSWLESFALSLSCSGLTSILTCQDSREVTDILADREVGVVVLDLMMPHLSGGDLLSMIRDRAPDMPVIIISGLDQVAEALKRSGGNQSLAARMLGISRQALNKRLKDAPA